MWSQYVGRLRTHTSDDICTEAIMSEHFNPQHIAVSASEAARLVGLGRTKLYELMGSGELPFIKIGTRRLIRVRDIEAFLDRQQAEA